MSRDRSCREVRVRAMAKYGAGAFSPVPEERDDPLRRHRPPSCPEEQRGVVCGGRHKSLNEMMILLAMFFHDGGTGCRQAFAAQRRGAALVEGVLILTNI